MLVFQSILPFLLFAGDEQASPVSITIQGGTNVSFSLSFEYLDQVLLPSLERFGVKIDRKLESRGWSYGNVQSGSVQFQFVPLPLGDSLKSPDWPIEQGKISKIDVSILALPELHAPLKAFLLAELHRVFIDTQVNFITVDNSGHKARIYTLLVAHTTTGLRFGRDWLYDKTTKNKAPEQLSIEIAKNVVKQLHKEIQKGGVVDEYLQDQLVIFQALAEGGSSIPGSNELLKSERERVDRTDEPFGEGSLHTTTARWVSGQLLSHAKWIDNGRICEGVGWKVFAKE